MITLRVNGNMQLFAGSKKTIRHCDAAVFTTYSAHETYVNRYPTISARKFHVIENGYEEDGFDDEVFKDNQVTTLEKQTISKSKITLLHSGLLYKDGRNPEPLFSAIQTLKNTGLLDANNFRLILRASGDDTYYQTLTSKYNLNELVCILPAIGYQQALTEMLMADGLLIFQGSTFNTQIPAKIYEYFRAQKPIFGLVDLQGETAKVLLKAGFSNQSDILNAHEIANALSLFIDQIKNGQAHRASPELITASSRKARTHELVEILNQIKQ